MSSLGIKQQKDGRLMSQNKEKTSYPIASLITTLLTSGILALIGYTFVAFTAGFQFHIIIPFLIGIVLWISGGIKVKISGSKQ